MNPVFIWNWSVSGFFPKSFLFFCDSFKCNCPKNCPVSSETVQKTAKVYKKSDPLLVKKQGILQWKKPDLHWEFECLQQNVFFWFQNQKMCARLPNLAQHFWTFYGFFTTGVFFLNLTKNNKDLLREFDWTQFQPVSNNCPETTIFWTVSLETGTKKRAFLA